MKKITLALENSEDVVRLRLEPLNDHEIAVTMGEWYLAGIRVVEGKLHLVRYCSISEPTVALDENGLIQEVKE